MNINYITMQCEIIEGAVIEYKEYQLSSETGYT